MSAYDEVKKGSLKFKGGGSCSVKKKKKKSKSDKEKIERALRESSAEVFQEVEKTEAELKFEEIQRKRQMERVSKAATKSHKDRVSEFNQKLEKLSEHHDIPKVGPG
ncbi:hypothetical protein G6F70_003907 [Rhizopus microsporus]|uniref:Protein FAM32A n=2 Tax=Rhizopus TaxID=4842 RepID=A0A367IZ91_RHIAZ|nr:hypothetical protein G6F71_003864 [Rhizopus microsporus]RCH83003.1 hypothetical protein CU097_002494 [Rhizopus azygosporus]KAG1200623.1 hypothetical protein G6F70_003907 [Rhizopus microsporus]KAG1212400.1 hypothetical protein G6F69_003752 [Rhizopus microsporus]KAG1234099.1 hypothetical protein G6F67_003773 [Rhizopus microsporus]